MQGLCLLTDYKRYLQHPNYHFLIVIFINKFSSLLNYFSFFFHRLNTKQICRQQLPTTLFSNSHNLKLIINFYVIFGNKRPYFFHFCTCIYTAQICKQYLPSTLHTDSHNLTITYIIHTNPIYTQPYTTTNTPHFLLVINDVQTILFRLIRRLFPLDMPMIKYVTAFSTYNIVLLNNISTLLKRTLILSICDLNSALCNHQMHCATYFEIPPSFSYNTK